jgi:Tol biopolymer transport system component/C-terminal processing protease CtpA/Prc
MWMRYPSISPDGKYICFTFKGDLYKVAATGGIAQQLTFHKAHDYMPVWSNDGGQITFASDRYGNFDVFVMSANGGQATRLTYHSTNEVPYTFTSDDKQILFGGARQDAVNHRQYPTGSQPEIYTIPVKGGRVDQLWTLPAENLQFNKAGNKILYHDKKGGENDWRKHHKSGIARDIWMYDMATKSHTQLTLKADEDRNPVFASDDKSYFYLSEVSGTFNVYKGSINNGKESVKITNFNLHPVRFLSISDEDVLCYGYHGNIYTQKEGSDPKKVEIKIITQDVSNSDSYIKINGGVQEMEISPNGKEIAVIAQGEVFITSIDGQMTKRVTTTASQERFISYDNEGKAIYYARENKGKWGIYKSTITRKEEPFFFASTILKEEEVLVNNNENYMPKISPDGKKIAYIENRKTLKVLSLVDKTTKTLMTSGELFHMRDGDKYFMWSPDSKWLLADYSPTMSNNELVLLSADGSEKMRNLTKSAYSDMRGKWVNEGKQILWMSNRDGLKSFATSGGSQMDIYTSFFTKDAWDKFNLSKEEYDLFKELEKITKENKKKEEEKKAASLVTVPDKNTKGSAKVKSSPAVKDTIKKDTSVKNIVFDWEDFEKRKAKLTIHSSLLSDAVLSKDGEKLYYLARFEKDINLWTTDLRTKETKMLIKLEARSGQLRWDNKNENLYLLSDGSISKLDLDKSSSKSIKIAGDMPMDEVAARVSMFEHVWIKNQGSFYISTMHGVDWPKMYTEYSPFVKNLGNSHEFAELLAEMLGELNVSHSGARYSTSMPNSDETASLGIFMDYSYTGQGIKIAEIIKSGPLDKAHVTIKKGDIITSIDGVTLSNEIDHASYLNQKRDKFIALGVGSELVTVKPMSLGDESRLLYQRWVKLNQDEVEKLSNGRLGYVHIPGMSDGPFRNVYDEMMGKFHDKEGIVVDTRFNGGGDLVSDLAMFFTGQKFITYANEEREVGYEPTFRWIKPTIALINEAQYSDGHCFSCGYQDLKIGKTVGMPVPGTCSFASWEMLPDGIRWGTVPISAKNIKGEWMENNETVPDVKVKNMPGKIDAGVDQQLEKAVEEMLKDIK